MSKWFEEVFLPSVFERTGSGKSRWLTAKQTNICTANMERHTARHENEFGGYYQHTYFTGVWNGRDITLAYSSKNGCGEITFGLTAAERAEAEKERVAEREKIKLDRIRRNPERYQKQLEKLQNELREIRQWIAENPAEADEMDEEEESILRDQVEELKARIAKVKEA